MKVSTAIYNLLIMQDVIKNIYLYHSLSISLERFKKRKTLSFWNSCMSFNCGGIEKVLVAV